MPFASQKSRRYLEMLKHNPKKAKEEGKSEKDMESIDKFVDESEKMPQPKLEKVPEADFGKSRFSKIKAKLKGK